MKPVFIINNHDYAEYIEELSPSRNDLDAEGSGRDVQTGEMFRTRVATKIKWDVKMNSLDEDIHKQLLSDILPAFFSITTLNPNTGNADTRTYYTSSVPFGVQRYKRDTGKPYYSGMSFSVTEK